jgi:hypothetical protein
MYDGFGVSLPMHLPIITSESESQKTFDFRHPSLSQAVWLMSFGCLIS